MSPEQVGGARSSTRGATSSPSGSCSPEMLDALARSSAAALSSTSFLRIRDAGPHAHRSRGEPRPRRRPRGALPGPRARPGAPVAHGGGLRRRPRGHRAAAPAPGGPDAPRGDRREARARRERRPGRRGARGSAVAGDPRVRHQHAPRPAGGRRPGPRRAVAAAGRARHLPRAARGRRHPRPDGAPRPGRALRHGPRALDVLHRARERPLPERHRVPRARPVPVEPRLQVGRRVPDRGHRPRPARPGPAAHPPLPPGRAARDAPRPLRGTGSAASASLFVEGAAEV